MMNFGRESKTAAIKPTLILFYASTAGLAVTFPTDSYQLNLRVCMLVMLFFLSMVLSQSIGGSHNILLKMKDAAPSVGQLRYCFKMMRLAG